MLERIVLDMDEVLYQWDKSAIEIFGKDFEEVQAKRYNNKEWDICPALGVTQERLNDIIKNQGYEWWADIELTPWARGLYEHCREFAEVIIVTAPMNHLDCHIGKLIAWKRDFGNLDIRIEKYKWLYEIPGENKSIIIDDSPRNCSSFHHSYLFPGYGNKKWKQRKYMDEICKTPSGVLEILNFLKKDLALERY